MSFLVNTPPSTPAPRPLYPRFHALYPRFRTLYPRTPLSTTSLIPPMTSTPPPPPPPPPHTHTHTHPPPNYNHTVHHRLQNTKPFLIKCYLCFTSSQFENGLTSQLQQHFVIFVDQLDAVHRSVLLQPNTVNRLCDLEL